ncbi:MAG: RNA polymerase subunit sigma [Planctomycetes bacterium]|nr:RNA polymerase subunit sigma [Planctomycetota bacterium]
MSGPIVRTGTTPEFWANWDHVFGDKSKKTAAAKKGTGKKKTAGKKANRKSTKASKK